MKTLIVLKPGWKDHSGLVLEITFGFYFTLTKEAKVSKRFWMKFYPSDVKTAEFKKKVKYLSSSSCFFIILEGEKVVELIKSRIGGIRKKYGRKSTDIENIAHSSRSNAEAKREIELFEKLYPPNRL